MSQPKVDIADPVVAGIALGKPLKRGKQSSGHYRIVVAPKPKVAVVLGVALPASSKVHAFS